MPTADLLDVTTAEGPFATAYLDTTHTTADADALVAGHWRAVREELAAGGADEATLAAMDEVVGADPARPGPQGQVVVAAGGRVLLAEHLPVPPRRQSGHWAPLPHLLPLVVQRADLVPHVVAVCDRVGADVTAYGPRGEHDEETVEGSSAYVHKIPGGGWAHRRLQSTVEEEWKTNASLVADLVDTLVGRTGARLVVLAGDTHAVGAVQDQLGAAAREAVVTVQEGGRGDGSDEQGLRERVDRLVAETAARDVLARVDDFREQRGRHERAVEGLAATVDAVRRAQVDTVLLVDRADATQTLWTGPEPLVLGTSREEVTALGVEEPFEDRADAVLVRALAATGADLVAVPDEVGIEDGIGALLRYSDASTPH